MEKRVFNLKNNIEVLYKRNKNTPRVALCFNLSLNDPVPNPGDYSLMTRLFLQGTKNRTAEQLSEELDKYAIEFTSELKLDYLKLKFVCLNEDFDKALEIFEDIVKNSTFEDFEKERIKLAGEIQAQLDSPRAKVVDNFYRNLYPNHHYGYTNTVILENLPNVTREDVLRGYNTFMHNSKKVMAFVGDLDFEEVQSKLNQRFGDIAPSVNEFPDIKIPVLNETKTVEIIKPDANQAHIIQGWLVDTAKKGLAYVVRSSYDVARLCANFSIYIATEPNNIMVSLKGFQEEIDKIKNNLVSEEELENAKNNLIGKWAFSQEDNNQQAATYAHYAITGLGFDFNEIAKEKIKAVTPEQIKECANKYFNDRYVVSIIKP